MIKSIQTNNAPAAIGPYSQAIIANGFVFCSGQIGLDPLTGELADGLENQTRQVLKNLRGVLQASESDLEFVVKTTIFLTDMANFSVVNDIYTEFFSEHQPARATVAVASLPKGALVEIEATAVIK